jgi:hypothetical protein
MEETAVHLVHMAHPNLVHVRIPALLGGHYQDRGVIRVNGIVVDYIQILKIPTESYFKKQYYVVDVYMNMVYRMLHTMMCVNYVVVEVVVVIGQHRDIMPNNHALVRILVHLEVI